MEEKCPKCGGALREELSGAEILLICENRVPTDDGTAYVCDFWCPKDEAPDEDF